MPEERRRLERTQVSGVRVCVKEMGFFGKKIDEEAQILDMSSVGLGISLCNELSVGKDYLIGFELHWLHEMRYIQVRVMNCIDLADEGRFRVGLRIIKDEHSTISFISTAIDEQKKRAKQEE